MIGGAGKEKKKQPRPAMRFIEASSSFLFNRFSSHLQSYSRLIGGLLALCQDKNLEPRQL